MSTHKPATMLKVWHLLSQEDRAVVCFQLVQNSPKHSHVYAGILPFVTLEDVITALDVSLLKNSVRRVKEIRSKLNAVAFGNEDQLVLKLNDGLVAKRFGNHPERGKPFRWLGPRRVDLQPVSDSPMHKSTSIVEVVPCVALIPTGQSGWWRVQCDAKYRQRVEEWLIDYCR